MRQERELCSRFIRRKLHLIEGEGCFGIPEKALTKIVVAIIPIAIVVWIVTLLVPDWVQAAGEALRKAIFGG